MSDSRLDRAIQYRTEERYDEARALFDALVAGDPNNASVNYHYAWLHDKMGDESGAVPYYERAISLGLPADELPGALLGLGSTYRTLGRYGQAIQTLERGLSEFPDRHEFAAFLAMAYYNVGEHRRAMELLLRSLAETSTAPGIQRYQRAILFYADKLDTTWP